MNNIKNEIEYATALKRTIDDFINKNFKLRRKYNLKEKILVKFIKSLCNLQGFYYKRRGNEYGWELYPSDNNEKTLSIICSNNILVLFPFERISISLPLNIIKKFTYLNQYSDILFETKSNSLQKIS